jgi:hypothetical protein
MIDYEIMYVLFEIILDFRNYYHREIQVHIFLDFSFPSHEIYYPKTLTFSIFIFIYTIINLFDNKILKKI